MECKVNKFIIENYLAENNITLDEFLAKCNISKEQFCEVTGSEGQKFMGLIYRIAAVLNVPVKELFVDKNIGDFDFLCEIGLI